MKEYECLRCGLITIFRSNFKRHLNRKFICNPIKNEISIEQIKNKYNIKESSQSHPKVILVQKFKKIILKILVIF